MPYAVRACDPLAARELGRALSLAPALAQVLLHRGLSDPDAARAFLSPALAGLTQPEAMADRDAAAERIASAIRRRERIAVFGDYDVDGTTSAVILAGALEELGADVTVRVGDRFRGGYGLCDEALDALLADRPSLLITCDCGSSDHERITRAARAGVDVIVVDHHLVPAEPLPAHAFLNPHRPECGFAYKGLASAGLALSLAAAVRARLGSQLDLRTYLDLVALGTIADVAPLDGDNRRLVRAGLSRLLSADARPGIVALRELSRLRPSALVSAIDVAFRITPRLNAPGRMGEPALALALLRATTVAEARGLAARIEQMNDARKAEEQRVTAEAFAQVVRVYGEAPQVPVVVASPTFHRGVVGITAARLCGRLGVPAVVVALDDTGIGHGSARGPDGFALYDALASCAAELLRFGGHQAAAGVTVTAARLDAFRAAFGRAPTSRGAAAGALPVADAELSADGFSVPTAKDLLQLEPVGMANPEPVFALRDAIVASSAVVKSAHRKLGLRVGAHALTAFGYDMAGVGIVSGQTVHALGHLRPDTYAGGERVELRLLAVEPANPSLRA